MKLTKKLEVEIKALMDNYWNSYFSGDIEHWSSYLVDDYRNIGGTGEEIWNSKQEILDYTHRVIGQVKGVSEIRNKQIQVIPYDPYVMVHELLDVYIKIKDEWSFYQKFRLSSLIQQQTGGWKVLHQHGSYPDSKTQEGEAFAFDTIRNENLKLQRAIESRTAELEQKTRELEIETALEKVRAEAMGMKKPDDILAICKVMFTQLQSLGFSELRNTLINFWDDESYSLIDYDYSTDTGGHKAKLSLSSHPVFEQFQQQIKNSQDAFAELKVTKDDLESWKQRRRDSGEYEDIRLNDIDALYYYFHSIGVGAIGISTFKAITGEKLSVLKRFRNVFDFAYRRYADVAQAEAQAREAQIELALERVRAKAMAMQGPADFVDVINVMGEQFIHLDFDIEWANFGANGLDISNGIDAWNFAVIPGSSPISNRLFIAYFDHSIFLEGVEQLDKYRRTGNDLFELTCGKEEKDRWLDHLFATTIFKDIPDDLKAMQYAKPGYTSSNIILKDTWLSIGKFDKQSFTDEQHAILKRFGKAFGQAYTRFLDLQKAEAQTKEAQIETALEKVRSRTMAMQSSNELQETAAVLFQEFKKLGSDNVYQVTIGIYNEADQLIDFRVTSWAGGGEQENRSFQLDMNEPTVLQHSVAAWKANKKSLVIDLTGDRLQAWIEYRNKMSGVNVSSQDTSGRRVISIAYFSKGHISISTPIPVPIETIKTLERFASVFDGTYTRFLDLEKAEAQAMRAEDDLIAIKEAKFKAEEAFTELQATQRQLIQSEKMASLGELTAGIAHEIQNPLNFVNNFSELSKELLDEMKEAISKGDADVAKDIMNDVIQNLEIINHHGKRADGIVKGMLQHSRSSSGHKEATDINELADEYLRLAYHGLRAKDKSFNVIMETAFDESIGKINIIPPEIGRVLLNLITNAFYVVAEKKKKNGKAFEPLVSVTTRKAGGRVEISVRDNGSGIPTHVLDKIFQPFFTTKPTGQGTGLGLSLSYDIVKAHGGELKVETKEGVGSEFIINLPAS